MFRKYLSNRTFLLTSAISIISVITFLIISGCGGAGGGGGSSSGSSVEIISTQTMGPSEGGDMTASLSVDNSLFPVTVNLSIPAGALASTIDITIGQVNNPPEDSNSDSNGIYIDFGPDTLSFSTPITVTISYNEADFPPGFDESKLKFYTFNSDTSKWEAVPTQTLYMAENIIVAELSHFSYYTTMVKKYNLNVSISPEGAGAVTPSAGSYAEGDTVILTAVAANEYEFSQWQGDANGSTNPKSITMDGDKNITAFFIQPDVPYYPLNITVTPNGWGQVNLNPAGGLYAEGTEVTLTGVGNGDYIFRTWLGSDLPTAANPSSLTMDSTKNVTAEFVLGRDLTTSVSPNDTGTVSPSSGTFPEGNSIYIKAFPNQGYVFYRWHGDVTQGQIYENPGNASGEGDLSVIAEFATPRTLTVIVSPNGSGTVALNPAGGSYAPNVEVDLDPTATNGWVFDQWAGDLSGSNDPHNNLVMNTSKTVYAVFVPQTYTLNRSQTGSGTTTVSPNLNDYPAGTVVQLSAVANSGNVFVNWNDDNNNLTNNLTLVMDSNKSYTAHFDTAWNDGGYISSGEGQYPKLRVDGSSNPYIAYADMAASNKIVVKKYNGSSWQTLGSVVDDSSIGGPEKFDLQFHGDVPFVAYPDSSNSGKIAIKKWNGSTWEKFVSPNCPFTSPVSFTMDIYDNEGTAVPYIAVIDSDSVGVYGVSGNAWIYKKINNPGLPVAYGRGLPVIKVSEKTHHTYGTFPYLILGFQNYGSGYVYSYDYNDHPLLGGWQSMQRHFNTNYTWNYEFNFETIGSGSYYFWRGSGMIIGAARNGSNLSGTLDGLKGLSLSLCSDSSSKPYICFYDFKSEYASTKPVRVLYYDGNAWKHLSSVNSGTKDNRDTSIIVIDGTAYVAFSEIGTGKIKVVSYSVE